MNRGKLLVNLALNNAGNNNDCAARVCIKENPTSKDVPERSVLNLPIFSEDNREIGSICTESFADMLLYIFSKKY